MKKVSLSLLFLAFIASCNNAPEEAPAEEVVVVEYEYFGDSTFATDNAIASTELMAFMGDRDSVEAVVKGSIAEVCQKKGCWMSMDIDNGNSMHVSYNYEFLLPLNSAGKEIIMNGYAFYDTIPVSRLQHLAEDAGKPQEEIDLITEPKATLAYLATGVMIKK